MPSILYLVGINHIYGVFMILTNKNNEIIYESAHKSVRATLSFCARKGICLRGVLLRRQNLRGLNLDGLCAPDAVFWGCDFAGSDMGYSCLQGADMRCSNLEDVCLAHADMTRADLRGAYFKGALVEGVNWKSARISCPSFWGADVMSSESMQGLIYVHRGEVEIVIRDKPLIFMGNDRRIVFFDDYCLWGASLYALRQMPADLVKELLRIEGKFQRFSRKSLRKMKILPMPKIDRSKAFH
jgi:uncharacterized protein YjbI with pentapeptide repeats